MTIVGSSVTKLVTKKSTQNKFSKDKEKDQADTVEIAED